MSELGVFAGLALLFSLLGVTGWAWSEGKWGVGWLALLAAFSMIAR